ncbi:hypothetical protein IAT38_001556 [Cryptococcus sp. DSM 104549]
MLILTAGALLVLRPLLTRAEPFPYNITLNDQASALTYLPSRDGPASSTWNSSYTDSPWSEYSIDAMGQGTSYHHTSAANASVTIEFVGCAVYAWGQASSGEVELRVDGEVVDSKGDGENLLASATGLKYGWHRTKVVVKGGSSVAFLGFTVTAGLGNVGLATSFSTMDFSTNGTFADGLSLDGAWRTTDTPATNSSYPHIISYAAYETVTFGLPANTTLLLIRGASRNTHGPYSVALSPASSTAAWPANQTFTGNTSWLTLDTIKYFASGLNPSVQYTVTVENQGKSALSLTDVTYGIVSKNTTVKATQSTLGTTGSIGATVTAIGSSTLGYATATVLGTGPGDGDSIAVGTTLPTTDSAVSADQQTVAGDQESQPEESWAKKNVGALVGTMSVRTRPVSEWQTRTETDSESGKSAALSEFPWAEIESAPETQSETGSREGEKLAARLEKSQESHRSEKKPEEGFV